MRVVAMLPVALLCSCVPTPEYYSVPPQHKMPGLGSDPVAGEYVRSAQADADTYYLKDVKSLEGSSWRWTNAEPEFRFHVRSNDNRLFRLDFGINDVTFKDTGPLRFIVRINGEELDRPVFSKPGDQRYEKPVPARLLRPGAENRVQIVVLNPWNAPDPGVRLGFLLHGVGFVNR